MEKIKPIAPKRYDWSCFNTMKVGDQKVFMFNDDYKRAFKAQTVCHACGNRKEMSFRTWKHYFGEDGYGMVVERIA